MRIFSEQEEKGMGVAKMGMLSMRRERERERLAVDRLIKFH
jgi:hypothetical protein